MTQHSRMVIMFVLLSLITLTFKGARRPSMCGGAPSRELLTEVAKREDLDEVLDEDGVPGFVTLGPVATTVLVDA